MGNGGGFCNPRLVCAWWLLLILFLARLSWSQSQICNPGDLNALRGFLQALDSGIQVWGFNASTSDCCGWPGVSCEQSGPLGGRIIGLDITNKSLKGSLSDSLAGLNQLRWLNLSLNSLRGPVPPQLLSLPRLELLDLSSNQLWSSNTLELHLPSIRVFNISRNSFNGSQPIVSTSVNLIVFDISYNSFSGPIDAGICNASSQLQILRLSNNALYGDFPIGFGNCGSLHELALDGNHISGALPDDLFGLSMLRLLFLQGNGLSGPLSRSLSKLSNLVQLDLSLNSFSGIMPDVFSSLPKLKSLSAQSNNFTGHLPASLSNLSSLRILNLRNNSFSGDIHLNFTAMPQLSYLDLGSNLLSGRIPDSLSHCVELKQLNLATNNLSGEIPDSFMNLEALSFLSLSKNGLSNISSALGILQHCLNLSSLVLTRNFHGEKMPSDEVKGFQNIEVLVIANCGLFGSIPQWLVNCSRLKVLDVSWNHLDGVIPLWFGNLNSLFYLDLSNNSLTGEIPNSLTQLKSLISGNNSQQGSLMPEFPFYMKRNITAKALQYNQISSFPPSLVLSNNMLVGPILPGFGNLKMLLVLDLRKNNLSGILPEELSNMSSLECLDLSYNNLSGGIPSSLTKLNFLSSFDVAYNNLSGPIPAGGQFSTFSSSDFEGNPGLCGFHLSPCSHEVPSQLVIREQKNRGVIVGMAFGIGIAAAFLLAIIYIIVSRSQSIKREDAGKVADAGEHIESFGSSLVLLFQNKDNKDPSIDDILKSTNNFDQAHIVGCGGFGLVYKATLPDGKKVAIKRLSGDFCQMEREFQSEVETLSRAQHHNLVMLQGYCRVRNDRLLIYSYMENGSLDSWLHEKQEGGSFLDWDKRLQIARGAASGLAYLHQSCQPHILHRDIKSSNILLNESFEAHLADFGLARLIMPYNTHVTTDLVGTLGYIPPEYGQSSVATFKGDVYSFGVVLLELLTGRRPVDMCKPKGSRDLIASVLQMKKEKREAEVFDPVIYDKVHEGQLMQVLEIACLCVSESPKLRPQTQQLVAWLDDIGFEGHMAT